MIPVRYQLELVASIRALRLEDRYVSEEEYQRLLARHLRLVLEMKNGQRTPLSHPYDVVPMSQPPATLRSLS